MLNRLSFRYPKGEILPPQPYEKKTVLKKIFKKIEFLCNILNLSVVYRVKGRKKPVKTA